MNINFPWSIEYSVGVEVFDEQHQHFFTIANKAVEFANSESTSVEELRSLIKELKDYALFHLRTEEEYFEKFRYPKKDADFHTAAHNGYREQVKRYNERLESENENLKPLLEEIAEYSGNWLASHIMKMDKQYSDFFHERGLK